MQDVAVIEDSAAALAALDPIKARLLAQLSIPASAASLAARVGLPTIPGGLASGEGKRR